MFLKAPLMLTKAHIYIYILVKDACRSRGNKARARALPSSARCGIYFIVAIIMYALLYIISVVYNNVYMHQKLAWIDATLCVMINIYMYTF